MVFAGYCCILSKFYIKPQHSALCEFRSLVVSYRNSTSNHNARGGFPGSLWLYLIEILHQTTTFRLAALPVARCILSKFYIKPQLGQRRYSFGLRCILSKFYIKPQPVWHKRSLQYVVSYRNSTSNHNSGVGVNATMSLYLIEILHQTTTHATSEAMN